MNEEEKKEYNNSFPMAPIFPEGYFKEQEERENKRLEEQKKRSVRQSRLGVLAEGLKLLGEGIGASKGALIQKREPERNVDLAYKSLEDYKGDHARALRAIEGDKLRTKLWEEGEKFRRGKDDRDFKANEAWREKQAGYMDKDEERKADTHTWKEEEYNWNKDNRITPERQHEMRLEQIEKQGEQTRQTLQTKNEVNAQPLIFIDNKSGKTYEVSNQAMNEMVNAYMNPYVKAKSFIANYAKNAANMDKKEAAQLYNEASSIIKEYEGDPSFEAIKKYNLTGSADLKDKGVLTTIMKRVWNEDVYNQTNRALSGATFVDNPAPANKHGEITSKPTDESLPTITQSEADQLSNEQPQKIELGNKEGDKTDVSSVDYRLLKPEQQKQKFEMALSGFRKIKQEKPQYYRNSAVDLAEELEKYYMSYNPVFYAQLEQAAEAKHKSITDVLQITALQYLEGQINEEKLF